MVVGVLAVGRYACEAAQHRRDAAAVSGARSRSRSACATGCQTAATADNNPVYLTSYSGCCSFLLVAWILIDRFVGDRRELEHLNIELERRVARRVRS